MKSILLAAACLGAAATVQAQCGADAPRMQYGFSLGLQHAIVQGPGEGVSGAPFQGPGFRLGVLAEYRVSRDFAFAPKAELAFHDAGLTLDDAVGDVGTYTLMPVAVEVMPHAVWRPGSGRTRAYVLAGPNLRLPLRLQADESTRFPTRWDVAMDLGVGLDRAFSRFHLAPELRYTYGWANVSQHPAVPEARLHNVTLALQFKG
jgi:hypothetical protein